MVTVVSNINAKGFNALSTKGRIAFAKELLKKADPLTPKRKGILIRSALVGKDGRDITYSTPYARRLWYGDTFNFRGSPIRGSRWVERAFANNKQHLMEFLDKMYKKGL